MADSARGPVAQLQALVFPVLMMLAVMVIVIPLPPALLDLLLALNVTLSVVILLTAISVRKPLEFSVFPSILLGTTLMRLVLNVASTRLILTNAATQGTTAAGHVIEAFGNFVAGGQLVIGFVIFAIIVIIQFIVITKGAVRIGEVSARFALDSMPGKQMSIDAEQQRGSISAEQAQKMRAELAAQMDFYATMDGASKFVQGDAIAGIVITVINIVGGLVIGMVVNGMELSRALVVFTTLTIGDGLVSQVPAFLISLAAGLLASRSSTESNLSSTVLEQLFSRSEAMLLAAGLVGALAFTGLPMLPLTLMGAGCIAIALAIRAKRLAETKAAQAVAAEKPTTSSPAETSEPKSKLSIEPVSLTIGEKLFPLIDPARGTLMAAIKDLRTKFAQELGLLLPPVTLAVSRELGEEYQIRIREAMVAQGELRLHALLAIEEGQVSNTIPGLSTKDPALGLPARWIDPGDQSRAEMFGYRVVEPEAVILAHLTEVLRMYAADLLSRTQVHELLDALHGRAPKLVEEIIPVAIKPAQLHQILCNLLREQVPIRDLETILETISDHVERTKDPLFLTEFCRHALSRTISQKYRDESRRLRAVVLDPALEDILSASNKDGDPLTITLTPAVADAIVNEMIEQLNGLVNTGFPPVVVCSPAVRAIVRQISQNRLPQVAILSQNEVSRDTDLEPVGIVMASAIKLQRPLSGAPTATPGTQAPGATPGSAATTNPANPSPFAGSLSGALGGRG